MASEETAVTMVNYYTSATATTRNQPVFVQYSMQHELKPDNLTNQVRSCSSCPAPSYTAGTLCFAQSVHKQFSVRAGNSSAFWEHGIQRRGAGVCLRSQSCAANHHRESVLPCDPGGSAAGRDIKISMLTGVAVVFRY